MDDAHVLYSLESIPWLQVGTSVASIKIALRDLRIPSYKERHLCFFFLFFVSRIKTVLTFVYVLRYFDLVKTKRFLRVSAHPELIIVPANQC